MKSLRALYASRHVYACTGTGTSGRDKQQRPQQVDLSTPSRCGPIKCLHLMSLLKQSHNPTWSMHMPRSHSLLCRVKGRLAAVAPQLAGLAASVVICSIYLARRGRGSGSGGGGPSGGGGGGGGDGSGSSGSNINQVRLRTAGFGQVASQTLRPQQPVQRTASCEAILAALLLLEQQDDAELLFALCSCPYSQEMSKKRVSGCLLKQAPKELSVGLL